MITIMYIFINENEIIPYNGDILKRYVGNRLVKTIANPTDEDLSEFGYLPLVREEQPEYNEETQYLSFRYVLGNGTIRKVWTVEENQVDGVEGDRSVNYG